MTAGDLEGVTVLGRPVKPVALGLSILMVALVAINIADAGELRDAALGDGIAVMAGTAAVCLWVGWIARSQRMAEAGLLLSTVVYVLRSAFIAFDAGFGSIGVYLGAGAAVIAGGAYLLETWDDQKIGKA